MTVAVARRPQSSASFDVLLVQRADTSFYPPTINQANLLAEAGLRVALLDGALAAEGMQSLHPRVTLVRPLAGHKYFHNVRFVSSLRDLLKSCDSGVCIAYESAAAAVLGFLPFNGRKIFHFHEYPLEKSLIWKKRALVRQAVFDAVAGCFARKVDCICIPDSHRAAAFYKEYKLLHLPAVVNNCPRRIEALEPGELRAHLRGLGKNAHYLLIFQGSISLSYYADIIVRSMPLWPRDSIMVFIGRVAAPMRRLLEQIAFDVGVSSQLVFLGQIPYPKVLRYTIDADIAFTMMKPVSFNFMYSAGASNKRYEALACGVPQIANIGPGLQELIEDHEVGVCVQADDPDEIGRAVAGLLADRERRRAMSAAARALHLSTFNYEAQFSTMRDRIVEWCKGRE